LNGVPHATGASGQTAHASVGFVESAKSIWRDGAIVLFVCVMVYWLFLGSTPFAASEGLRVAPGWAMLDSGDWSRTEMFGLNYVRKPPGMPWAIATSSAIFGQNEFAARAPSALACTLMALIALGFGRAWCGPRAGLAAGLAQALLPLMWAGGGGGAGGPGRSAEIEAVNTFFTQLAVLPLIALMLPSRAPELGAARNAKRAAGLAALAAAGILGFALTKTAASVPCVAGAIIGVCLARRSARPLMCAWMWGAVLSGGIAAYFALRHFAAINNDADAVRETGAFLWQNPLGVLTLIPIAFAAALPMSIALLIPIGKDARAEGESSDAAWSRCVLAGRACGFAWFASCLLYAAIGIDNPRYLMPASVFLAPIVGYIIRGMAAGGTGPFARAGFMEHRRDILKRIIYRGPWAWAGALIGLAIIFNTGRSILPPTTSRTVGTALAEALPAGATVWADDLIEARPDILLYARQAADSSGRTLTFLWAKPRMHKAELPEPTEAGSFVLLRTDERSGEGPRYVEAMESQRLRLVMQSALGKYTFALFRVHDPEPDVAAPAE
jgi:4-amino-4-deoxy-L-arabinose transferase-like glycosyltransferase